MDHRAVFVGMDLGTFKTAVATAHGVREVIPTAVGKPKDHVARTLLGRATQISTADTTTALSANRNAGT